MSRQWLEVRAKEFYIDWTDVERDWTTISSSIDDVVVDPDGKHATVRITADLTIGCAGFIIGTKTKERREQPRQVGAALGNPHQQS